MHTDPVQPVEAGDESPPIVLLVDDSIDVHRLLNARLRSESLRLVNAATGPEAMAAAQTQPLSTILLDLDMPGMDGFELLRWFKENPETSSVPVIVISCLNDPHDKVTAFDLGATDYVTKPFELAELRVRVRSALRLNALMKMLSQRALLDGLSGLWNRRYFDDRWADEVSRSARHARPLSIALFDLDHFKGINDTYGHPAGDEVISMFARLLRREVRASDVPCRIGGEEFALIMADTGPADAHVICERIRVAIQHLTWPRHPNRSVTVSCGIAGAATATAVSPEAWLEAADNALYASKQSGRNRITIADLVSGARVSRSA
jgi:diguanylate cyclase (GGDEF)-like protein